MNKISRDLELEKQLDAYVKGKLSEEQALQLWEKLLKRPKYIELLETELGVRSILQEDGSLYKPERKGVAGYLYKYWHWAAAAASIVILAVTLSYFPFNTEPTIAELIPDNIDLKENLITSEIIRSQNSQVSPGDSLLNYGFTKAMDGDIEGALETYDEIINSFDDMSTVAEAYLNKGIIYYNLDDFEKAVSSFQMVIEKEEDKRAFIREKAYWYLGNGEAHLENYREAREAMQNAYEMNGLYRDPAYRMIQRLEDNIQEQNKLPA
jgi:tetratricopeptide (TPR) repeat protein